MKRILLPASGALVATGLLAAGLAGAASADPKDQGTVESYLAQRAEEAAGTIDFWTKSNNEALRQATAFHYDYKSVKKIVQKGGYNPDGKPGVVPAIGEEKKTTVKVQNVNLPKTIGKVFFQTRDGDLYWCSGTSVQSNYRNLVATAGHCVYEDVKNEEVVSRWVFVPMYYQGKTPAGIYVGKQAFTHYDFTNYEDFDRDYAFVTVYDGIKGGENGETGKEVSYDAYKAFTGPKWVDEELKKVSLEDYNKWVGQTGRVGKVVTGTAQQTTGPDDKRGVYTPKEVTSADYAAAAKGTDVVEIGAKAFQSVTIISDEAAAEYADLKANPAKRPNAKYWEKSESYLGTITPSGGGKSATLTRSYVKQWIIPGTDAEYYIVVPHFFVTSLVHVGRLGDNVGGQGFAWNQPTGKYVRTFGYPFAQHPDGSKPYSGVTPKWCYGKTQGKGPVSPSTYKVEEQIALKCAVTGGYDGGAWLLKYSNAKRLGYLNGVTSLFLDNDGNGRIDNITSPYFDGETALVYNAAKNVASGKILP